MASAFGRDTPALLQCGQENEGECEAKERQRDQKEGEDHVDPRLRNARTLPQNIGNCPKGLVTCCLDPA